MHNTGELEGYVAGERRRSRRAIRWIAVVAGLAVLTYISGSPFFISTSDVGYFLPAAIIMLAVAAAYYLVIGRPYWINHSWVDVPFFLAAFFCQLSMSTAFFGRSLGIGLSPSALVSIHTCMLMFAASVSIVAAPIILICLLSTFFVISAGLVLYLSTGALASLANLMPIGTALCVTIYAGLSIDNTKRRAFELRYSLAKQKERSDKLLYNVLPKDVADRLRVDSTIADALGEVSVIFVDIVGFSDFARRTLPRNLLETLNKFFLCADTRADEIGVHKVKTIGDAYLAVARCRDESENCALLAIEFAFRLIEELKNIPSSNGFKIHVRVGIHTGAVIGGVIGSTRKVYDYWGDTVNVASRIQSEAEPDSIFVSESTRVRAGDGFYFGEAQLKNLKGVGETKLYQTFRRFDREHVTST
jgi:adenylate cyclase